MEHAFAQTHSAESFPKGLASRRDSGDSVACARDDRVGRSEGFAICHPERSAQREVEGSRAAPAEEGSTPAVAFEHVSKRFGDAVAVDDANLDIDEGAFVTIIGSSGCGKTTLLKMVNALAMPDDGRVLVHGKDTSGVDPIELRRNIGYAIQGSVLFPHLTVEQNIAYVPSLLNSGDEGRTEEAVVKWMDIIGLPHDIMDRYPAELSGGQAQRVGIARALAASPDILLADEPFSAVDAITRGSLQDEIKRIHRQTGITVLFVTHDIDEALDLGDKVLVMEAGRAVQFAEPCDILRNPATVLKDRDDAVAKRLVDKVLKTPRFAAFDQSVLRFPNSATFRQKHRGSLHRRTPALSSRWLAAQPHPTRSAPPSELLHAT